jgi:hypothetical protein
MHLLNQPIDYILSVHRLNYDAYHGHGSFDKMVYSVYAEFDTHVYNLFNTYGKDKVKTFVSLINQSNVYELAKG